LEKNHRKISAFKEIHGYQMFWCYCCRCSIARYWGIRHLDILVKTIGEYFSIERTKIQRQLPDKEWQDLIDFEEETQ
jgi:hypothetical protein